MSTKHTVPLPGVPASKRLKMASSETNSLHVGFIGGGNLGRSMVQGMLKADERKKKTIFASFSSTGEKYKKMQSLGVNVTTNNKDIIINSDVIVIAVKPYQVMSILDELQKIYQDINDSQSLIGSSPSPKNLRPLIISVAAAVTVKQIEDKTKISWKMSGTDMVGHLPVVRCLPNVASSVGAGVTVYTSGHYCNEQDTKLFLDIFNSFGICHEVPEQHISGLASISGSGIAFLALVLEGMIDGGVLVGIPHPLSRQLAAHTMMSTAKMVLEGGLQPDEIKVAVSSPAGTTIQGLKVMENARVRGAIMGAIEITTEKAKDLCPAPSSQ